MPLYEYQCGKCGTFELIRKFSDAPLEACPTCGGVVEKLLSSPAIQFKGTGWYVTDYAGKSSGSKDAGGKESSKDSSKDSSSNKKESSSSGSGSSGSGSGDKT
jgi:putative FmdB family regulatory protein